MNGGGAEREGDTKSEAGSRLWAISPEPDAGLELTDREIVTRAEVGRSTDWATQAPLTFIFERDRVQVGEGQTEGDTEFEAGSRPWAVSTEPDVGLEFTVLGERTRPELKLDA